MTLYIINQIFNEIMKIRITSNVTNDVLIRLIYIVTLVACHEISAFLEESAYFWTTLIRMTLYIINQIFNEIMKIRITSNVTNDVLIRLIYIVTLVACHEISAFLEESAYFWTTKISIYV